MSSSFRVQQVMRATNLVFVGPLMIWGGQRIMGQNRGATRALGQWLLLAGVVSTVYNGLEWLGGVRGGALPGGLGDRTLPSGVSASELEQGVQVESEHTTDPDVAREIAFDHLTEDPLYYSHLAQMEADHQGASG